MAVSPFFISMEAQPACLNVAAGGQTISDGVFYIQIQPADCGIRHWHNPVQEDIPRQAELWTGSRPFQRSPEKLACASQCSTLWFKCRNVNMAKRLPLPEINTVPSSRLRMSGIDLRFSFSQPLSAGCDALSQLIRVVIDAGRQIVRLKERKFEHPQLSAVACVQSAQTSIDAAMAGQRLIMARGIAHDGAPDVQRPLQPFPVARRRSFKMVSCETEGAFTPCADSQPLKARAPHSAGRPVIVRNCSHSCALQAAAHRKAPRRNFVSSRIPRSIGILDDPVMRPFALCHGRFSQTSCESPA